MSEKLLEPLPTVLSAIAVAMRNGMHQVSAGKGGGSYNWPSVVERQRDLATAFLREKMERLTEGGRTIRMADASLLPEGFPVMPLFLAVVCDAGRPERTVSQLQAGDHLYAIAAPDEISHGLWLVRLA